MSISTKRASEIIDALRRGTVLCASLDAFCVGLERFESAVDADLAAVAAGGRGVFKAVRGDYGCGKTFFTRWLADRARKRGFVTSEVQISETETPLHKLETVYRRLMERLATADTPEGALRNVVDGWFHVLEEDVIAEGTSPDDAALLVARTTALLETRLAKVTNHAPLFAAAIRGYRQAAVAGDRATADGLLAWAAGQPHVAAGIKKTAGIKGDLDHFGALGFLQGMLTMLRDAGYAGLLVVLDEVETIQRVKSDARDKSLNALRQLIDEIEGGRFPGLFLLITGTPAFYDGPQGVQRLEPLAQRLHVDFQTEARFDNPRAVQMRLPPFDLDRLCAVGVKIRDIFRSCASAPDRIAATCDDAYIRRLAEAVTGKLGGKVGIAPRIFLKKLVADVLDRVDQHPDFNPLTNYTLTLAESELTPVEREAVGAKSVDDISLDL